MKKFTLLFVAILGLCLVNAQSVIDFETASGIVWKDLANPNGAPVEVDNPVPGGINTSSKVLKFNLAQDAVKFAGTWADVDMFTVTGSNLIRMKVYKPVISANAFKLEPGNRGTGSAIEIGGVSNTKTNEWETLEFNYSDYTGQTYSRIAIMPEWTENRTGDVTCYVDDIEFFPEATSIFEKQLDNSKVYVSNDKVIYKSSANLTEVSIVSISGSVVMKETQIDGEINISQLPNGIYLVVLKAGNEYNAFKILK